MKFDIDQKRRKTDKKYNTFFAECFDIFRIYLSISYYTGTPL